MGELWKTLVVVVILILYYETCRCKARDAPLCSNRCGVHNISHPFRLQEDPVGCGDLRYNLSCEEENQLMLYLESGSKYHVQSINYNNYTIRLLDANLSNSSLPLPPSSLGLYNLSPLSYSAPYRVYNLEYHPYSFDMLMKPILSVSCPNRVESISSGVYVDNSSSAACINTSYAHGNSVLYLDVEDVPLWNLGLGDSCRIESMYLTSWPPAENIGHGNANISCTDIRHMLFYGFELSWVNSLCKYPYWYAELDDNHHLHCVRESGNLNWLVLYILNLIAASVVLLCGAKFVLGGPCIIVLIICKWRRKHLSMYDSIEDFLRSDNNIMPISQIYFPFWVYDQINNGQEIPIENDTDEEMKLAKKMMIVALWCIQTRPSDRPSMDKVLEMLEASDELQMPNKPYLFPQDIPSEDVIHHSSSRPSSEKSM
ncbi:Wall-associated receptor kinase, galacturonan-binding domain [Sesbania bispinosa]|nr:Wall-associated receptor kinase, galacturonan-binding domain [Sesbania bispinosa]